MQPEQFEVGALYMFHGSVVRARSRVGRRGIFVETRRPFKELALDVAYVRPIIKSTERE